MKILNLDHRDVVAGTLLSLWILTTVIGYIYAGQDGMLLAQIFNAIIVSLMAKYRWPAKLVRWMN